MNVWRVSPSQENAQIGEVCGPVYKAKCALGKSGVTAQSEKREGDGKTPAGTYPFRRVFYRPDRLEKPITKLPLVVLSADLGWCDAADSERYNKLVRLPFGRSHEKLWRDDHVYDVIVEIGHNDNPVKPEFGSAVFMHIAREGYQPTEGCVALSLNDMQNFIRLVQPEDHLKIG